MVSAILEKHKFKLFNYLAKASRRINDKEEAYKKLEKEIRKVKVIGAEKDTKPAAQKRKLGLALKGLRKSMIEVIEAEKMMKFMRRAKTAEEIAMENMIVELEGKLDSYIDFREKKLKRFEELEKKVAETVEKPELLPSPKPVAEEKLPMKISEKKAGKEAVAAIRKEISALKGRLSKLKKSKKYPKAKLAAIEKKIKEYNKRLEKIIK